MVKKRLRDTDAPRKLSTASSTSGEDFQTLDVTFDFYNFIPSDFHSIKTFLKQLFDVDALDIDISALADAVVIQDTVGSSLKEVVEETEGGDKDGNAEGSDAFGFLSVLRTVFGQEEDAGEAAGYSKKAQDAVKGALKWIRNRVGAGSKITALLEEQENGKVEGDGIGLLLCERMINCPAELAPPMYACLLDELEAAVEDAEHYSFSHFLVLSKVYEEVESLLNEEDEGPKNKKSRVGETGEEVAEYLHEEDRVLRDFAVESRLFDYARDGGHGGADSRRAFTDMGIRTRGLCMLLEANKFTEAVKTIKQGA